jgi:DNA polymerase III delta prime subunit
MYIPWLEKYKPNNFSSFKINNLLLKNYSNNYFNNCILYGSPGVGKTTFIHLLTEKMYHKDDIKLNVLSLNASDERGINSVRNKIKTFAKKSVYGNYKFKIIILDEADSLTYEAQTALRRIIEIYSKNTRFCFICNYDNKIINPIKSRCNIIKFNNFSNKYIKNFLINIIKNENINQNFIQFIDIILEISNNDLRKSIIYLETITKLNINLVNNKIIYELFNILNQNYLKENLKNIKELSDINKNINNFNSFSLKDLINIFCDFIIDIDINDEKKYKFLILLSEIDNIKNKNINYNIVIIKILSEYLSLIN